MIKYKNLILKINDFIVIKFVKDNKTLIIKGFIIKCLKKSNRIHIRSIIEGIGVEKRISLNMPTINSIQILDKNK